MKIKEAFAKLNILIIFPVILVMTLDVILTLVGQPRYYWYDYSLAWEGSPIGYFLLSKHPVYFVLFFIFYLLFVVYLIAKLKKPLNIAAWFSFFISHIWGGASWLPTIFDKSVLIGIEYSSWYLKIGYFVIISAVSSICINRWLILKRQELKDSF